MNITESSLKDLKNEDEQIAEIEKFIKNDLKAALKETRTETVIISGPWGVGKTVHTWAIINEYTNNDHEYFVFRDEFSLLPFGSIIESLKSYTTVLTDRLWREGIVDIRKEMSMLLPGILPEDKNNTTVSMSLGPITFSRNLTAVNDSKKIIDQLENKLLAAKKEKIFLVIDDIDRLRPEEIIDVFRFIEQLKKIPKLAIFIPINRNIILSAFKGLTAGDSFQAELFFRRFSPFEFPLRNNLSQFKEIFMNKLPITDKSMEKLSKKYKDQVWGMLVINLVFRNGIKLLEGVNDDVDSNLKDIYSQSGTLRKFWELIVTSRNKNLSNVSSTTGAEDDEIRLTTITGSKIKGLGDSFPDLINMSSAISRADTINALKFIWNNTNNILLQTYFRSDEFHNSLNNKGEIDASVNIIQNEKPRGKVLDLLNEIANNSINEDLITDNYTNRDIENFATIISVNINKNLNDIEKFKQIKKIINRFNR